MSDTDWLDTKVSPENELRFALENFTESLVAGATTKLERQLAQMNINASKRQAIIAQYVAGLRHSMLAQAQAMLLQQHHIETLENRLNQQLEALEGLHGKIIKLESGFEQVRVATAQPTFLIGEEHCSLGPLGIEGLWNGYSDK